MEPRPPLRSIRLVCPVAAPVPALAAEFPSVRVTFVDGADVESPAAPVVDEEAWLDATTFRPFDEAIEAARSDALVVRGREIGAVACEVLTRFQRFVDRRNDASRAPVFDAVLAAHRAMHDTSKPLVKADLDHAIDAWQWLLRLSPDAGLAVQLAALFHDVERLESEPDARVEQHAPDYQAFKDAHARRGGDVAYDVLVGCGVDRKTAVRTRAIIATHERRGIDPDVDLLNDADALSFFSLNSSGYADYFGHAQTRKKVAYTLGRLGPSARARLAAVRLRRDVRSHLQEVMAA